jgi:cyanate lyase
MRFGWPLPFTVKYAQIYIQISSSISKCIHLQSTIQAKLSTEELDRLASALDTPCFTLQNDLGEHWWPNRGLGEVPPKDPVIYRLYESVLVYGHAIKVRSVRILFHEEGI